MLCESQIAALSTRSATRRGYSSAPICGSHNLLDFIRNTQNISRFFVEKLQSFPPKNNRPSTSFHVLPRHSMSFHVLPRPSIAFQVFPPPSMDFHGPPWPSMAFHSLLWPSHAFRCLPRPSTSFCHFVVLFKHFL